MSGNGSSAQKKQLALGLERAMSRAVGNGAQLQGQGLPCHVLSRACGIVTVAFDVSSGGFTLPQVTCPIAESEYVLLPIQPGDKGFVTSASARLGGVSGLGAGLAPLVTPSNLGGLVFVPVGNKAWTTPDANAVIVQGPNGAIIRTMDGAATVIVNENKISLNYGGKTVVIDPSGITLTAAENTVQGDLTVNGNTTVTGNVSITGAVGITGSFSVGGPVTMTGAVAIVGTLSVNGKDFQGHDHEPGTYKAGSTFITGISGGVAP